jgi:hypothetical protein
VRMNKVGASGSPYRTPWARLNGAPLSPLIMTDVRAERRIPHIRFRKRPPNPLRRSISKRNSHESASNAFDMSIFIRTAGDHG